MKIQHIQKFSLITRYRNTFNLNLKPREKYMFIRLKSSLRYICKRYIIIITFNNILQDQYSFIDAAILWSTFAIVFVWTVWGIIWAELEPLFWSTRRILALKIVIANVCVRKPCVWVYRDVELLPAIPMIKEIRILKGGTLTPFGHKAEISAIWGIVFTFPRF